MIREALYKYLNTITAITSELTTYQFTADTNSPAIFAGDAVPKDHKNSCIFIGKPLGGEDFSTKAYKGLTIYLDVNLFSDKVRSQKGFDDLAITLWKNLHRADLSSHLPSGWDSWKLTADAPQSFADEDSFPAYRISVKCTVLNNE